MAFDVDLDQLIRQRSARLQRLLEISALTTDRRCLSEFHRGKIERVRADLVELLGIRRRLQQLAGTTAAPYARRDGG